MFDRIISRSYKGTSARGSAPPLRKTTMTKTYIVTIGHKFPAYGEQPSTLEISAKNKAVAISEARKEAQRGCWFSRLDGPVTYTATEAY